VTHPNLLSKKSQPSALLKIETALVKISAVRARDAISRVKLQMREPGKKTLTSVKQVAKILRVRLNLSRVNPKDEAVVKVKTTVTSKILQPKLRAQRKLRVRAVMTNRRLKDARHLSVLVTTISDVVDQGQTLPQKTT
jgi:hypothetical protein